MRKSPGRRHAHPGWNRIAQVEFGYIPGPDLIGIGGQQFGFAVEGALNVRPTFFDIAMFGLQDTIHGTWRAEVASLIEQGGINFRRRPILETFAVQYIQDNLLFRDSQRQRGFRSTGLRFSRFQLAVKSSPRDVKCLTGGLFPDIFA